jgi:hypothetical protein
VAGKPRNKTKKKRWNEWRAVSLNILGRNLDPDRITEFLHIQPDDSGKRGECLGKLPVKAIRGNWTLEGGPSNWRIEKQMKSILKRSSPVKHKLQKIIEEDNKVDRAYLAISCAPPVECPDLCYYFDAELTDEFTSIGIDIYLSINIKERWEKIFAEVEAKNQQLTKRKEEGVVGRRRN